MKKLIIAHLFVLLVASAGLGQRSYLITDISAGNVRLGMTVSQARKAMKGDVLKRTSDGEGIYLVVVLRRAKELMYLYAGDGDQRERINEKAKIEQIWVFDNRFKTVEGVHPDMLIKDAEKKYGRIKQIELTSIEQREFADFSMQPSGLLFRVGGVKDYAGIYVFPKTTASKYRNGSLIESINVVGR